MAGIPFHRYVYGKIVGTIGAHPMAFPSDRVRPVSFASLPLKGRIGIATVGIPD